MHSNKIIYPFLIILCFAPLISARRSQLHPDYYNVTCPSLQVVVWWGVWNASKIDPRMPASLLRLHFHDCFVNGCDASVLLDDANGERSANPNINSLRGFKVIDDIKATVEKYCPNIVSCADILALAARAAVKLSYLHFGMAVKEKWQPWEAGCGRLDGSDSDKELANRVMPSPTDPLDTIIAKFSAMGLGLTDMVVLSGAHTIGDARCSSFMARMNPSNRDPTMGPNLYQYLQGACKGKDTNVAQLDRMTPKHFDVQYYTNLLTDEGVLKSDQALLTNRMTKSMVTGYSTNQTSFMTDFGVAMVKMGNIDVITAKGPSRRKGTIRKKCSIRNK